MHAVLVYVCANRCALFERRRENGRRITVSVEYRLKIEAEMRDLWCDAALETPEFETCRRSNKGSCVSVYDARDNVQRFDDRALTCVILADDDSAGLEGDRVVPKTSVIYEPESSQHVGFRSPVVRR